MPSKNAVQQKNRLPEIILILGMTGAGKSTFIKAASGLDVEVGHHLESCKSFRCYSMTRSSYIVLTLRGGTAEVQIYPIANSHTFLIDTPGFDDQARSDTDILQSIASCLADMFEGHSFENLTVTLSGVIYIHSINEARMSGSMKRNLKMFKALVGNDHMNSCVLVTSKWTLEDENVAQQRESDLIQTAEFWGGLLAAGATIRRFEGDRRSALEIIELSKQAGYFRPQLTQEYVIEGMELYQTVAGRALDQEITEARDRQEKVLRKWQLEHDEALRSSDIKAAADLKAFSHDTEEKIRRLDDEIRQLRECATRERLQTHLDASESEISRSDYKDTVAPTTHDEKSHKRRRRAFRWFARSFAMGGAVAMTVVSHGVMLPVGISLVGGVEAVLQQMKDREWKKSNRALDDD